MAFHRVLITSAVAMCIFYGVWELLRNYERSPSAASIKASIAWSIGIAAIYYLWRIRGKK